MILSTSLQLAMELAENPIRFSRQASFEWGLELWGLQRAFHQLVVARMELRISFQGRVEFACHRILSRAAEYDQVRVNIEYYLQKETRRNNVVQVASFLRGIFPRGNLFVQTA